MLPGGVFIRRSGIDEIEWFFLDLCLPFLKNQKEVRDFFYAFSCFAAQEPFLFPQRFFK